MNNTLDPTLTADESFARSTITSDASDHWPPSPTVVRHTLAGALADRIRTRFHAEPHDEVTLTETTIYGGYSVYTQENSTEFTVTCGMHSRDFHPHGGTQDWRQDAGSTWADSVYARFDAWLAVEERPEQMFAEWFEFQGESPAVVRYRSKADTTLTRTARELHWTLDHLNLTGIADGDGFGRAWLLDFVGAPDATGAGQILKSFPVCWAEGLTVNLAVVLQILAEITDELMPGKERY